MVVRPDVVESAEKASDVVQLQEVETNRLELARERVVNAELVLKLRKAELQQVIDSTVTAYSEAGKYQVLGIDPVKGTLERRERVNE